MKLRRGDTEQPRARQLAELDEALAELRAERARRALEAKALDAEIARLERDRDALRREIAEERARDPETVIQDAVRDVLFRGAALSRIDGSFVEDGYLDAEGRPTGRWTGGIPQELRAEAHRRLAAAGAEYRWLRAENDRLPLDQRRTIRHAELEPFVHGERRKVAERVGV